MTVYPPLWAFDNRRFSHMGAAAGEGQGSGAGSGSATGSAGSGAAHTNQVDPEPPPSSTVGIGIPARVTAGGAGEGEVSEWGQTYPRRYWCLFMLTASSALQTMTWMTYATTADQIQQLYGWSSLSINLLTTWGPAFYVPVSLLCVSWFDSRFGVRAGVTLCMTLTWLGSVLRVLVSPSSAWALPLAHIGSIVNAVGAPFTKATPSSLSMIWFSSDQRTWSTAIGSMAPYIGICIAFLLTLSVHTSHDLSNLLIMQAIITTIFFILQCFDHCFTSTPPVPPSYSQYLMIRNQHQTHTSNSNRNTDTNTHDIDTPISTPAIHRSCMGKLRYKFGVFVQQTIAILSNTSFVLIVCVYGLSNGVYTGWSGILYLILKPLNFSQTEAAWLGFGLTLTGIIGACMIAPIIDYFYPYTQIKHTHTTTDTHYSQSTSHNHTNTNNNTAGNTTVTVTPTATSTSALPHDTFADDGLYDVSSPVHPDSTTSNASDDTDHHLIDTSDMERAQRNPVLPNQHVLSEDCNLTAHDHSVHASTCSRSARCCVGCSSCYGYDCCMSGCMSTSSRSRSRPTNRDLLLFLFGTTSILFLFCTLQANQYYKAHAAILYIIILLASMFVCATIPLSYESCVESVYPGSPTLANSISSSSSHIIQSVYILSQNIFTSHILNWILTITMMLSFILICIWKEHIARHTLDQHI